MRQGGGERVESAPDNRPGGLLRRLARRRNAPAPAVAEPAAPGPGAAPAGASGGAAPEAPHTVRDDFPHRYLLRSSAAPDSPVRALVRALPADPRRPAVVVDVPQAAAGNLGGELGALLARLRDEEPLSLRLVLSGAAAPAGEDGPLAQRLADAWNVTLEAPDAPAVLAPGGLLYVTEPATPGGGWWRFAPGEAPEPLGARLPAPRWQRALARVPLGPVGGSVVRAVPAGLALAPADSAPPRPDEPAYAVAVHPDRPAVLLGAPRAEPVAAEDLATLLVSLPSEVRRTLRLVPVDGRDATALAEEVCDLLGTELEVTLGLPLATEPTEPTEPSEPAEPSGGGGAEDRDGAGTPVETVRLVSAEGEFAWPAPLAALLCFPLAADGSRPAPRPTAWTLPESAGVPEPEPATLRMPSGARAVAVRSGLWIGPTGEPPAEVRDRAGEPRVLRVEIASDCLAGEAVRAATLRDLSALVAALAPAARAHAELAVSGEAGPEAVAALRRFAVRAGLSLAAVPHPETPGASEEPATAPAPLPPTTEQDAHRSTGAGTEADTEPGTEPEPDARPAGVPDPLQVPAPAPVPSPAPAPVPSPPAVATSSAASAASAASAGTAGTAAPAVSAVSAPVPVPAQPTASPAPAPATAPPSRPSPPSPPPSSPRPSLPSPSAPAVVPASVSRTRRLREESAGEPDRRAFRELAAKVWEEHSGPVGQALIRMPALRGADEDAVRADLIAVRLYLSSAPEDPFGARALAAGGEELRPYAGCLAAGLRRLPALRGTLVRAAAEPSVPDEVVPGAVLSCDAPLDAVHLEAPGAPLPPPDRVRYVIRPTTARRTSVLSRDGSGVQALFATGTEFTVLARHEADGELPARVLLAELPPDAGRFRAPSAGVLERLDAVAGRPGSTGAAPWPDRCTGPFLHVPPPR
ncbi:hypothetical protein [Streptomyces sp. NPDC001744]|uniref:hypothetical protein n=1 Tax=Streptomyces sp. NPDC001744 TaxID=3364606 RepID=UPI003691F30B